MIQGIDHIAIAVSDLASAEATYTRLLGCSPYKREHVASQSVRVVYFKVGTIQIELVAGEGASHPLKEFLARRGEGLHHIAFSVKDANTAQQHIRALGFRPIGDSAQAGGNNKKVVFVHPKDTHGALIELCADK